MVHISTDRLRTILSHAHGAAIAVLGDVMVDRYFWGSVSRISPEAPVPVVDVESETYHLGGAANVAANIRSLGATPILFGVVGDDATGSLLERLTVEAGLDSHGLVTAPRRPTTVKTRVIGNNQQLIRLDREVRTEVGSKIVEQVVAKLQSQENLKAIVLEDYDKGFLSDEMITSVVALANKIEVPVFVDPKRHALTAYSGVYLYKPNRKEASDVLGRPLPTADDVVEAGRELQVKLNCPNILITLGSSGMMLFEDQGIVSSVPTRARSVADVSGAGDTAIATLAVCVAGKASVKEASALANAAAGVVVSMPGIVSITQEALVEVIQQDEQRIPSHTT